MSERKVLNKYYPPDFDPSKIPRMKLAKNRQYTVRLMAPFNMRCKTCGEYIYKGKKFNARKEDVENETYLGIRIYRFYIKCTRCLQEISFKTDPQNTDYEIEAGATRNFMALKLAEEQARKEIEEEREEEANNPMKLLENRTQQSRNEIEMLESLEELRDLNRRQHNVDYESMLQQYNSAESEQERLKREEKEDEEFVKSINFKANKTAGKIVAEEIIEEINDEASLSSEAKKAKLNTAILAPQAHSSKTKAVTIKTSTLVKRKTPLVVPKLNPPTATVSSAGLGASTSKTESLKPTENKNGGLSLLSSYASTSEESE
ncbi:PREDICTED: coiled-coil domain-containing protein 94 [Rhagoletis zephyria]|uniref:coiled-coil domain-containing protein 94 n=1 Tax=Rhagoletis zephyria TaxID=28612 RepID=UPI0008114DCD|nr:PREDICTED: coiled-coil domain-containing protein 94 [Rhagoletis zephyria]XP_017486766.1 PREDICTED: coiled-coil domain-containing protein 94 [Rhagoletis zephyria]XP_036335803.1 splicing factor YJU2 [Rhagoletis pomonella]